MRSKLRVFSIIATLIFSLSQTREMAAQTPDLCRRRPCVQIGTFNIEWLGTPERHEPRPRRVIEQIANLITRTLDLEIVMLQEINTSSEEYRQLGEALAARGYELRQAGDTAQQDIAIAFDPRAVRLLGNLTELGVRTDISLAGNCRYGNLRRPLVAHFRAGRFDFLLIGLHLKSQLPVNSAADPEGCADEVRREQGVDLRGALPALMAEAREQDVILIGDFNATPEDPSLAPLLQAAENFPPFELLTHPQRRARASSHFSYLPIRYRSLIDHLMIRTSVTREWVNRSGYVLNPPRNRRAYEAYLRWISDHVPVWASFRTDMNDDD